MLFDVPARPRGGVAGGITVCACRSSSLSRCGAATPLGGTAGSIAACACRSSSPCRSLAVVVVVWSPPGGIVGGIAACACRSLSPSRCGATTPLGGHEGTGGEEGQEVRGLVEAHSADAVVAADRLSIYTLRRAVSDLAAPFPTRSGR